MSEIKLGESQGGDFLGEAPHLLTERGNQWHIISYRQ